MIDSHDNKYARKPLAWRWPSVVGLLPYMVARNAIGSWGKKGSMYRNKACTKKKSGNAIVPATEKTRKFSQDSVTL